MAISGEGQIGISLSLLGLGGGAAMFVLPHPYADIVGWGGIAISILGLAGLGLHNVWTRLPLLRRKQGLILLDEAAVQLYEAIEKAGRLDKFFAASQASDQRLGRAREMILADAATEIYGAIPPSSQQMLIPRSELDGKDLVAGPGSALLPVLPLDAEPVYVAVGIRRSDLDRLKRTFT